MSPGSTLRVGVLGGTGFAGAELLRLVAGHPGLEVVFASSESHAGVAVGEVLPNLARVYPNLTLLPWADVPSGLDVVFVALPHGKSQAIVPKLDAELLIDLGGDFRLEDPGQYEKWYGELHSAPDLLRTFRYGMVELFRDQLVGATAIAVPGCYVTATALTLAPLLAHRVVVPHGIVVDAASGVSGAGRDPRPGTTFGAVSEDFKAYGLLNHRHTPEMEMALSRSADTPVELLFTPHLAPMNRGILATCYLRPTSGHTSGDLLRLVSDFYEGEQFIRVSEEIPNTKATLGSNSVHITVRRDERTGWVLALGALDNLIKGAAGQAIQCLNVSLGLGEAVGLEMAGLFS